MQDSVGPYDVALSYAGEQRGYVHQVAERLRKAGVKVFFDEYEQTQLWGRDLAVHFDSVYRAGARFVVPFVSTEYAAKAWPQHEFRSALAKAVEAKSTYLLPVRFDFTELPGLRPTIHYLDGSKLSPEQVAAAIIAKVRGSAQSEVAVPQPGTTRLPMLPPTNFNPYAEAERAVQLLRDELPKRAPELSSRGFGVHHQDRNGRFMLRVMRSGEMVYGLDVWIGGDWGDNSICFATGTRGIGNFTGTNAIGSIEWDRQRGLPLVKLQNFSLLPNMAHEYRLTTAELLEEVWDALCRQLEQDSRNG